MLKLYKSLLLTVICISSVCNIGTGYCSNNTPRKTVFSFDKRQIRQGDFSSININNYEIISIGIDPAATSGLNSDKTGIIVTGIRKDINNNKYYTDILENYSGIFGIVGNLYYKYNNDLYKPIDNTTEQFYKLNQDFVVDNHKIYTKGKDLQINHDNLHYISDLQLKLAYTINKYKPHNIVFEKNQGHDFVTFAIQQAVQMSNKHDVKLIPFFSQKDTIQINEAQNNSGQLKNAKEKRANIVRGYLDTHDVIFNKDILFVDNSIEYTGLVQIMLNEKRVHSPDELDALHMSLFGNHNMNLYWFNGCNGTEFKNKLKRHTNRFIKYALLLNVKTKKLQGNEQMDTDNEWEQNNENNGADSDYGGDNDPNNNPDNSNDDNPNKKNRKTSDKKNMQQGFKNKDNNNSHTTNQYARNNANKNEYTATAKSDSKKLTLHDIAKKLKPANDNDSRNSNNIHNDGNKKILQNTFNKNLKIEDENKMHYSAMKHNKQNAIQNNSDKKNKYNENNTSIQKREKQEYDKKILEEVNKLVRFNIQYEILKHKKISKNEMQQYANTVLELLEKDIIQYQNSSQIKEYNTNNEFMKICRSAEILTFDLIKTTNGLNEEYMRILREKQLNDQYIKKLDKEKKYSEDEKIPNKKVVNNRNETSDIDCDQKSEEMNMIIELTDNETKKAENRQNINKNEHKSSNNSHNQKRALFSALREYHNEINTSGNSNQNIKIEQNENNNKEKSVINDSRDYTNEHQNIGSNNNKDELGRNINSLNDQLMLVKSLSNSVLLDNNVANIEVKANKDMFSLKMNRSFESNVGNNNDNINPNNYNNVEVNNNSNSQMNIDETPKEKNKYEEQYNNNNIELDENKENLKKDYYKDNYDSHYKNNKYNSYNKHNWYNLHNYNYNAYKNNNSDSQLLIGKKVQRQDDNQIIKQQMNKERENTKIEKRKKELHKHIMAQREEQMRKDTIMEKVNETRSEIEKWINDTFNIEQGQVDIDISEYNQAIYKIKDRIKNDFEYYRKKGHYIDLAYVLNEYYTTAKILKQMMNDNSITNQDLQRYIRDDYNFMIRGLRGANKQAGFIIYDANKI